MANGTIKKGSLVKNTGGSGGGGSASFPTIVTDSGSSLPVDLTGYNDGDTFLDTSDKKIYRTEGTITGYSLATGVTNSATFDGTTGIVSGFQQPKYSPISVPAKYIYKITSSVFWSGNLNFQIVFQMDTINNATKGCIVDLVNGGSSQSSPKKRVYFYVGTDNKIYYAEADSPSGTTWTAIKDVILLDFAINNTTKYKLSLQKTDNSLFAELKNADTDEVLVSNTIEADDMIISTGYSTTISYGLMGTSELKGEIYLAESSGDFVTPTTSLSWDSGTDLTDKTEYADKTNGILYLYQDTELIQIPLIDLSNYKLKATTTTIDTASVTVSEIKANTNYVFSNNAITDITLSGCETSFEETTIEFTTGSTAPTLTDNSGITWVDGSAPTLNASKSYIIVIFNKLGFVKEY